MKAYEIYLSGVGEVEITLCDPKMVEDFLNKNYGPYLEDYDLDLDELKFVNEAAAENFDGVIENHSMLFYGTCKNCLHEK